MGEKCQNTRFRGAKKWGVSDQYRFEVNESEKKQERLGHMGDGPLQRAFRISQRPVHLMVDHIYVGAGLFGAKTRMEGRRKRSGHGNCNTYTSVMIPIHTHKLFAPRRTSNFVSHLVLYPSGKVTLTAWSWLVYPLLGKRTWRNRICINLAVTSPPEFI